MINTNISLADVIWRPVDMSKSTDGLSGFLSGFMGGREAAANRNRETAKVDALNEATKGSSTKPVERPRGNFFTDVMRGALAAPGIARREADPLFRLKELSAQTQLQEAQLGLRAKELELSSTADDQKTFSTWMDEAAKNPDGDFQMPSFKTPKFQAMAIGIQRLKNQSTQAKSQLKITTQFNSDMSKLANVGTPEAAAEYSKIRGMVDDNGNPTDEAILNLGQALKTNNAAPRPAMDFDAIPGKVIIHVPGSKSFQVKDLNVANPAIKARLTDALARRRILLSKMNSMDYVINKQKMDDEKARLDNEIEGLYSTIEQTPAPTTPANGQDNDPLGIRK